jgi:hypothetical protein
MSKKYLFIFTAIAIIVLLIVGFQWCKNSKTTNQDSEKVTISKTELTNLLKQASDVKIVTHDTIIFKDKIVIRDHNIPIPVLAKDSTRIYTDHIKNSDIDITLTDSIHGTLLNRSFTYIPIVKIEKIEITKTIPQIISVEPPTPIPKSKLQLAMLITTQQFKTNLLGAEIGFINKNNLGIHYQYQTDLKDIKYHTIKLSKTFNF